MHVSHSRYQFSYIGFVLFLAFTTIALGKSHYVQFADANWAAIIGPPPASHSAQQREEIARILELQSMRTPVQIKRCKEEASVNEFYFARVLGPHFNQHEFPVTGELLHEAYSDAQAISEKLKHQWNRQRPYVADTRINPCVALEKSSSYPSGHAERGIIWATILSQIYPDKRELLMAAGQQLGQNRILAGVHYPSDVAAGQKLGAAIAAKLLANHDFQQHLEKAREECLSSPVH
ncbi:MAG TPA: phosphatase PAP2 family protein [Tepidisphaeraceae bacterium]|jgi:acid phosphatase (class A)